MASYFGSVPNALALGKTEPLTIEKASGGTVTFAVEIARSEQEKAKGLMFRTKLGDGEGMLFPYGRSMEVTMWMRNTYIPLDMVFIKPDGTIHRIAERTQPLSDELIGSDGPVSAVLEIAGGAAGRLGIKPGDKVHHAEFGSLK
ncbi:MAG TPA: DUF192 domain-containing protein [Hyphomicrobium sp.]|nr:DUF192 domain-containing protein [Hyphomicrobium sp.]